jgi:hypothetical protein
MSVDLSRKVPLFPHAAEFVSRRRELILGSVKRSVGTNNR